LLYDAFLTEVLFEFHVKQTLRVTLSRYEPKRNSSTNL